ncbi:MAG: HIT family protein [Rhodospirillales bacterium]|nr:HIT family protein [Rhodospirillales bacterium]
MPRSEPAVCACPFCVAGIASAAFADDERFLALYDISPVLPGHSLIVPRRHVKSLLGLSDEELAAMMVFARRTTRLLTRVFSADGFDWAIQDGAAAGQTVPHLHLHIIPRHDGDLPDPGDWYPALIASEAATIDSRLRPRLTTAEHAQITEKLRAFAAADSDQA